MSGINKNKLTEEEASKNVKAELSQRFQMASIQQLIDGLANKCWCHK